MKNVVFNRPLSLECHHFSFFVVLLSACNEQLVLVRPYYFMYRLKDVVEIFHLKVIIKINAFHGISFIEW